MHPVITPDRIELLHGIIRRRIGSEHERDRIEIDPQQGDRTDRLDRRAITRNQQRVACRGILIGDLHIAGHPMLAHYTAFKSGHALNNRLLRALLADTSSHEIVSFDDERRAPAGFAELAPAW